MSRRRKIVLLLWGYFWLLIFEGALRKWLLPGLSTPLLVVRDPIALLAVVLALPYLFRSRWVGWVLGLWLIAGLAVIFALTAGHGDWVTALYGARSLILHFPLIFVFAVVCTRDDVWRFLTALGLVAMPMTLLAAMQYSLPQSHWVNMAPGGEEGVGFSGALGRFRPPGTFSFTNGLVEFYGLASAAVAAFLFAGKKPIPKWCYLSLASLVAALPISISRALFWKFGANVAAVVLTALLGGKGVKQFALALAALVVLALGVSRIPVVQDAQTAFQARWEMANEQEGDEAGALGALQHRTEQGTLEALRTSLDQPVLGKGIGLGTNVGAMRRIGKMKFTVAESEWGNIFGELGPLLGYPLLLMRIVLAGVLFKLALAQIRRNNPLPMILSGVAVTTMLLGTSAQPTSLGFIVLASGLMLAACNPTQRELTQNAERRARPNLRGESKALTVGRWGEPRVA